VYRKITLYSPHKEKIGKAMPIEVMAASTAFPDMATNSPSLR
jgi:hypothetical protein